MTLSIRRVESVGGFTLVELMVVLLLLAVLGGLLFSVASGVFQKGDRGRAESELQAIGVALEAYRKRFGDYPEAVTPNQLFAALDGKRGPGPGAELLEPAFPPFLEAGKFTVADEDTPILLDPWGEPYVYRYRKDVSSKLTGFSLFSKGPDGLSSPEGTSSENRDKDNLRYGD